MVISDDHGVEISSNDSQGWGEVISTSGQLTRGVVEPVVDHQQQPENGLLDRLEVEGDDNDTVEHEGAGAIQVYQLVLPVSGIGSLLPNELEVGVPEATIHPDLREGSHVVYWVSVNAGLANWRIPRTLREFEVLHNALYLVEGIDSVCIPQFPGRCFLESTCSTSDPSLVEQCRESLHNYLQAVCARDEMWKCRDVEFLDVQTSMLSTQISILRGGPVDSRQQLEKGRRDVQQQHTAGPLIWKPAHARKRSTSSLAQERCCDDSSHESAGELGDAPAETQILYPMTAQIHCAVEGLILETEASCHSDGSTQCQSRSLSRSRSFVSASNRTSISARPLLSALAPEIDMSDLDNLAKRIACFSSDIADEEYDGLCATFSPSTAPNSVDRMLTGGLSAEEKHGVDDAGSISSSFSTKAAASNPNHSPNLSCTHNATDEHVRVSIPGGKRGVFLKCLRKGSSIFGDPDDPLFHNDYPQGSTAPAAYTADSQ